MFLFFFRFKKMSPASFCTFLKVCVISHSCLCYVSFMLVRRADCRHVPRFARCGRLAPARLAARAPSEIENAKKVVVMKDDTYILASGWSPQPIEHSVSTIAAILPIRNPAMLDLLTQSSQCRSTAKLNILASRLPLFPDCPIRRCSLYS